MDKAKALRAKAEAIKEKAKEKERKAIPMAKEKGRKVKEKAIKAKEKPKANGITREIGTTNTIGMAKETEIHGPELVAEILPKVTLQGRHFQRRKTEGLANFTFKEIAAKATNAAIGIQEYANIGKTETAV